MDLADLKGQVVLINFWASWCGPCRQEMPILDQLYRSYQAAGFTLLGVNVEPNASDAQKFLKGTPVSFPILFDPESKVSKLYEVSGMPSTSSWIATARCATSTTATSRAMRANTSIRSGR